MTTRWEVEQAALWSNLRPLSRLVLLVLLAKADNETAVIPPQHTPSLSTLAAATGLSRSVAAEQLNYLEALGWVMRGRPAKKSRYARTTYAMAVGKADPERPAVREPDCSSGPGDGRQASGPADGLVREPDDSQAAETSSAVQDADGSGGCSSPGDGHASTKTKNSSTKSSKKGTRPKVDEIPRPDADEICTYLADKIGTYAKRPAINKDWRTAARLLLDDEDRPVQATVTGVKALIDWVAKSDFWRPNVMSMPTLREKYDRLRLAALQDWQKDHPKASRARDEPYRNPTDPNAYDDWNPTGKRDAA